MVLAGHLQAQAPRAVGRDREGQALFREGCTLPFMTAGPAQIPETGSLGFAPRPGLLKARPAENLGHPEEGRP